MKKFIGTGIVLFSFAVLILFAYPNLSESHRPTCGDGVCIQTTVEEPVRLNEPATVTIMVTTARDISNLDISLYAQPSPSNVSPINSLDKLNANTPAEENRVHWLVDAQADTPMIVSSVIQFPPTEGIYDVVVSACTSTQTVIDMVHVDLTHQTQVQSFAAPYPGPSDVPYPTTRPPTASPKTAIATRPKPTIIIIFVTPPPPRTGSAGTKTPRPASTKPPFPTSQITVVAPTKAGTIRPPTIARITLMPGTAVRVTAVPITLVAPTARPPTSAPRTPPPTPPKPTVPPYP
ncbi:MAG: hypothetical protein HZB51_25960 [Chloroflexi bacterium]|nr:hypothetical protein [Chloroflexota bacterium]